MPTEGVGDACLDAPRTELGIDLVWARAACSCTFSISSSFFNLASRKANATISARSDLPLDATDCMSSVRLIIPGCPGAAAAALFISTGVELVPDDE